MGEVWMRDDTVDDTEYRESFTLHKDKHRAVKHMCEALPLPLNYDVFKEANLHMPSFSGSFTRRQTEVWGKKRETVTLTVLRVNDGQITNKQTNKKKE